MHRTLILCAVAALMSFPAQAASESQKGSMIVFGMRDCAPKFECSILSSGENRAEITKKLVSISSSCISTYLSLRRPEGYFDESYGLNSSDCLEVKNIKPEAGAEGVMIPICCLKKDTSGKCFMHCEKLLKK